MDEELGRDSDGALRGCLTRARDVRQQRKFRLYALTQGWHTFRHSVGTMLADIGEHQLTIRYYLRHSNLHITNKYLQATSKTKRLAQDKLVDAILPTGILPKTNLIQ
jgi:integrase